MKVVTHFILTLTTVPCHSFSPVNNHSSHKATSLSVSKDTAPPEVYPLSQRKALLIKEAQRLDPSLAKDGKGSYSPVGWSNRLGTVLTPVASNIYTADRPFYWNKIDVGCRMTVIRLSNNDLVVHSPIGLDPPLLEALQKLDGRVVHVISPNYEHVKYAAQWGEKFTDANMWGCPGLMEREDQVRWTGEIGFHARPPGYSEWIGASDKCIEETTANESNMWDWKELQPFHIDVEANPFTGRPFFNEVVFYHPQSKTLLTTDLYWNYPRGDGVTNGQIEDEMGGVKSKDDYGVWELAPNVGDIPWGSKAWKVGMDKIFRPFYNNFMIKSEQKEKFQEIARFITFGDTSGGWEIETIIPAHGDIIRGKEICRKVLERHFNICRNDSKPSPYNDLEGHYISTATLQWLKKIALSYKLQKGEDLLDVIQREGPEVTSTDYKRENEDPLLQLARACALSQLLIASHDFLRHPNGTAIYNYGNIAFLNAFGYEWEEFVELPSSKCVDTEEDVEARQELLDAVKENPNSNAYNLDVVRVRKDKRKILLKNVNLFNIYDIVEGIDMESARIDIENGEMKAIGQAVWIKQVEYLD